MTFREYLCGLRPDGSNARAIVISDVQSDSEMPDVHQWAQLESYLMTRFASDWALDEAEVLWRDYQRILDS